MKDISFLVFTNENYFDLLYLTLPYTIENTKHLNKTLFRKDADKNEIAGFMRDPDKYCKVWREFQTDELPSHWVVWPHSESKGWCDRITGQLTHNTVS